MAIPACLHTHLQCHTNAGQRHVKNAGQKHCQNRRLSCCLVSFKGYQVQPPSPTFSTLRSTHNFLRNVYADSVFENTSDQRLLSVTTSRTLSTASTALVPTKAYRPHCLLQYLVESIRACSGLHPPTTFGQRRCSLGVPVLSGVPARLLGGACPMAIRGRQGGV